MKCCWRCYQLAAAAACAATLCLRATAPPALQPPLPQANGLGSVAAAEELAWGTCAAHLQPPFDVVLASDVLYLAESLPLFVQTLRQLCSADSRVLLCNEHRPALPFPWALFRGAGFDVRQVPLSEQHPEWRSEDIHLFDIRLAAAAASSTQRQPQP